MIQFFFVMLMLVVGMIILPIMLITKLIASTFEEKPKSSRKPDPIKSS